MNPEYGRSTKVVFNHSLEIDKIRRFKWIDIVDLLGGMTLDCCWCVDESKREVEAQQKKRMN